MKTSVMHPRFAVMLSLLLISSVFLGLIRVDGPLGQERISSLSPPGDDPTISWTNVSGPSNLGTWSGNFFSWADFDDDGDQDLLVNGGRLLVNSGAPSYSFTDQSGARGIPGGFNTATWGDVDNDGDLDLAFGGTNSDMIYFNSGAPTYTFSNSGILQISNTAPTQGMSLRDWDGDGWLDLYVMNSEIWNDQNPQYFRDFFYVNDQQGGFTNRSDLISSEAYYGRGISWGDYDRDFDSDLYVGNYRIVPNRFYENTQNGTSPRVLNERTSNTSDPANALEGEIRYYNSQPYWGHTIGSAFGDLNNDGYPEIVTANLVHLYYDSNDIRGLICDYSQFYSHDPVAGVEWGDFRPNSGIDFKPRGGSGTYQGDELYSGVALGDVDNDGDLDMWLPQIYDLAYAKAELWINNGDFQFTLSPDTKLQVINTYGGTFVDYDNDGDLDLLTGGQDGVGQTNLLHLFRNDGPVGDTNHWLGVEIEGRDGAPQVGASVEVWRNGSPVQYREVAGAEGPSASGAPLEVHFGLGADGTAVDLLVTWPDNSIRWLRNVTPNQHITVQHIGNIGANVVDSNLSLQGSPSSIEEGEVALLEISGIPDGWFVSVDTGADGIIDYFSTNWSSITSNPISILFENQGDRTIRMVAWDPASGAGSGSGLKVRVVAIAPQPRLEYPAYILPSTFVTFDASTTWDAVWDKAHMEYRWEWDDGFSRDFSSLATYVRSFSDPGTYNLTMTARDEQGLTGQMELSVLVAEPIPNATVSAPSIVNMDSLATFVVELLEGTPNEDNVTFRFAWGDGSAREWNSDSQAAHTWTTPGDIQVNISVRNEWGKQVNYYHNISVSNVAPEINWTATTSSVQAGDLALFQVMVSDTVSDRSMLSVSWFVDDEQIIGESNLLILLTLTEPGSHNISATVTDSQGEYATIQAQIDVIAIQVAEMDLMIFDGFLVDDTIFSSIMTQVQWDISEGHDWQVIEIAGIDSDGFITSDSGVVIDLWSETRQQKIYRELTVIPMLIETPSQLDACEVYQAEVGNIPNGAGVTWRWQTSFGWVNISDELSATVDEKEVEAEIQFNNKTVIISGFTSSFVGLSSANSINEVQQSAGVCTVFFRIGDGEWIDFNTTSEQILGLSSGVYNIEWIIEDKGYSNFGGVITHTVEPANAEDGSVVQEPSGFGPSKVMWVIIAIILLFVVGGSLITGVILVLRVRNQIKIENSETQDKSSELP